MVASRVARTIPILIAVCFLSLPAFAQYGGGSGYPGNPYLIYTAEQLNAIGTRPQDFDRHFKLMADIDLSAYTGTDFNMIGYLKPGGQREPFKGVFDGNGHSIANFTYVSSGADRVGLFGYVWGAEIKDLLLIDPNVDVGTGRFAGLLVGQLLDGGRVSGCFVQGGTITGGEGIGGLVGYSSGVISDCHASANVTGLQQLGGLVGSNESGTIAACYATGTVSGERIIGGLAGQNGAYYGGREGHFWSGTIENCYSTCDVNGVSEVGGLVGYNHVGSIAYCYSRGAVVGEDETGGLVGKDDASITECFWDIETSGLVFSAGGEGKTMAQMQTAATFRSWGACSSLWAINEGLDSPRLIWENMPGQVISGEAYGGGAGTAESPYLIRTAEQLNAIGLYSCDWDKHFRLMADIDLSGVDGQDGREAFNVIGVDEWNSFTGVFDGNGHTISHVVLTGGDNLGVFGRVEAGATVKKVAVVDAVIKSSGDIVGVLVGQNLGDLIGCYAKGTVIGNQYVGGLVGANGGHIVRCHSVAEVTGEEKVGGLAGGSAGELRESFSSGSVHGRLETGGLAGRNRWGTIVNCYSTCLVSGQSIAGGMSGLNVGRITTSYGAGAVTGDGHVGGLVGYDQEVIYSTTFFGNAVGSFWDVEKSGQSGIAGRGGLTTKEMQGLSVFLEAGWDFMHETANGRDDIWKMWDGYDYPRLAWELGPDTPLVFVDIDDPGFYGQMSRYEVTNAQYRDFLNAALASGDITVNGTKVEGADGSNSGEDYAGQLYYKSDGSGYTGYGATNGGAARIRYNAGAFGVENGFGDHPVTYVSWYGAMAFANYYGYYLPAEDQWQAVADCDGTHIYGCGQTIDPGIANYRVSEHPDGTMPVGSFGAYGYGMSDMAGNVWEWTSSVLGSNRVFRGGSLGSVESDCAVSIRGDGIPHAAYWDIGFRVCR